ncbi:MAG: PASTA domain-containing protein [Candidatus Aminicenantes bacterium]|nr:MAG: PASTA domain-containing protein [Candidatus Aminicenantes bacterium]
MVTLPGLIGKSLEEAKNELARKKLSIAQRGVQFNNRWEKGKVIYQDPSPNSKIKINKVVKVILSAGSEKVEAPRLIGQNLQSIGEILREAGLRKGKTSQVHTSRFAAGKIIAQYPLASEEVGRNTNVSLLVSQGENEKKYLMPDLIGKRADFVIAKLKEMNFNVGDVRYAYYPRLGSGIVIKQTPPHGYRIQKRNLITLEVSK